MTEQSKFNKLRELLTQKEKEIEEFEKHAPLIIEWFINKLGNYFGCEQGSIKFSDFYRDKIHKFNVTIRIPYKLELSPQNKMEIMDFEFSFYLISPSSNIIYTDEFTEDIKNNGININSDLNILFDWIFDKIILKIENL